jgi:hypothetical protein
MTKSPKVLCVVAHGLYSPWINILYGGQEVTWLAKEMPENFEILHFHGTPLGHLGQKLDSIHERIRWSTRIAHTVLRTIDFLLTLPFLVFIPKAVESKLSGIRHKVIHVRIPDGYLTMRWKSKGIFKYALENYDFDYLFITTTSSYIRPSQLLKTLEGQNRKFFFGGAKAYEGANFIAGSNRILSRDLVDLVVSRPFSYLPHIIEDVSLSRSLRSYGVEFTFFNHLDIDSIDRLSTFSNEELVNTYHFRVKSGPLHDRKDIEVMQELHKRFYEIENSPREVQHD